jgi:hypothetical protein
MTFGLKQRPKVIRNFDHEFRKRRGTFGLSPVSGDPSWQCQKPAIIFNHQVNLTRLLALQRLNGIDDFSSTPAE